MMVSVLATIHSINMDPQKYEELLEIGAMAYRKKYGYREQRAVPGRRQVANSKYSMHSGAVSVSKRTHRVKINQTYSHLSYKNPNMSFKQMSLALIN